MSVEAEQIEGLKAEEGREGGETVIQVHDEGRWQLVPVCYLAAARTYTKDVRNTWRLITPCVLYSLAEEVVLLLAAIAYGDHSQMWSGSVLEIAEKEACMNGSRLDISPGEQMLSRVSTYVMSRTRSWLARHTAACTYTVQKSMYDFLCQLFNGYIIGKDHVIEIRSYTYLLSYRGI